MKHTKMRRDLLMVVVVSISLAILVIPRLSEGLHEPGETSAECMLCHHDAQEDGEVYAIQPNAGATDNHHGDGPGATYTCTLAACHPTGGVVPATTDAYCRSCHTDIVNGVNHHIAAVGDCVDCHLPGVNTLGVDVAVTGPGIQPVNFNCLTCHQFPTDAGPAIHPNSGAGDNHHGSSAVPSTSCTTTCHPGGGVSPDLSDNDFCILCHRPQNPDSPINPGVNHHVGLCVSCHIPQDGVGAGGVTGPGVTPLVFNCMTCHIAAQGDVYAIQPDSGAGDNHHGASGDTTSCTTFCHTVSGVLPSTSNAFCSQCHNPDSDTSINPGVDHHLGTCVNCHLPGVNTLGDGVGVTGPGVTPLSYDCSVCHAKFGEDEETVLNRMNHPNKTGTPDCEVCHLGDAPSGTAPPITICNGCHGGVNGRDAAAPETPFLSKSKLTKALRAGMHKNVAPVASMTVVVDGLSVTVTDTSTDADGNLKSVQIQWGDKSTTNTHPAATETHTFSTPGKKKITLTVTDMRGRTAKVKQTITVSAPT